MNFTENKGKQAEKTNNQISEEKILEYANNTFEYTEIPEEMKEEYIQEFTSSYKETIAKSEEDIEADIQSLKEEEVIEEAEETQTKEDKVAEIVRSKVEKNLLIKIEEQETKAQIPDDGYEYTEDGQIGMNSAGYEGLPPDEWEIEAMKADEERMRKAEERNKGSKSNQTGKDKIEGPNSKTGKVEIGVPDELTEGPENIAPKVKGDE